MPRIEQAKLVLVQRSQQQQLSQAIAEPNNVADAFREKNAVLAAERQAQVMTLARASTAQKEELDAMERRPLQCVEV